MSPLIYANTATFNGNDLTAITGVTILGSDAYKPAKRKLNVIEIARSPLARTNSAFYKERTITLRIGITRSTRDLAEISLDSLLNLLAGVEKELIIKQSDTTRKYICTFADSEITNAGGSYIEIDLMFNCPDRFGYDIAPTLLLQISGYTSSVKTDLITVGGSAPTQVPLITYTITALTSGASKNIVIGNGRTGQAVTINRTWTAGDVIQIDCKNQTVKVNGTDVNFTGAIPEWETGVQYITYSDTLATRTFSGQVTYYKRYV